MKVFRASLGLSLLVLVMVPCLAMAQEPSAPPEDDPPKSDEWTLYTNYQYSDLGNRGSWSTVDTELYYAPSDRWSMSVSASHRRRNEQSDTIYGLHGSYQATPRLEVHGSIYQTPDPDFSYRRGYGLGLEYQATDRVDVLLDARRLEFEQGSITEIRPGARFHATDQTAITARYTSGRAFGARSYDGWSVRMDHRFENNHRLSVGYANGADPEMEPGAPDVILSDSSTVSVGYRFPVRQNVDMVLGAEYEDRPGSYHRTGVSAGVIVRF